MAVVSTTPGTLAASYGFQAGDIVRSVNGQEPHNVGELVRALNATTRWELVVERGNQKLTLNVE